MHDGRCDSSSIEAFQNKSQVGCYCMYAMFLDLVIRMKFKTNLVFCICLVVVYGFMESFKDMAANNFGKPSIFQGKRCYKPSSLMMVNGVKWGGKLEN